MNDREDELITLGLRRKTDLQKINFERGTLSREKVTKVCACGNEFKTHFPTQSRLATHFGIDTSKCFKCRAKLRVAEDRDEVLKSERETYEHRQQLIKNALFPFDMETTSFETSDKKIHPTEMAEAQTYAEGFTTASRGLIIQSGALEVGTGKTWMAVCIGRMVVETGKRVLFKTARDFLMELRQTFDTNVAEIDRLRSFLNVSLLILDDAGRDYPSEWVQNTYWSIFDICMSNRVPVIVTTNKPVEQDVEDNLEYRIGAGAYSRLLKICGHKVIHLGGLDLR